MICVDVLALWGWLAVISVVTDSIVMYLSLVGCKAAPIAGPK